MTHPIVACARGWIGTRFHHQGRLRKTESHSGGADCLGLLAGVAAELDLRDGGGTPLASFDDTRYSHQPDTKQLREKLAGLLTVIPTQDIVPGDVLLIKIDESPQHLAIVSDLPDGLGVIHAYAQARGVVEHRLDDWWKSKIEAAYRVISMPCDVPAEPS